STTSPTPSTPIPRWARARWKPAWSRWACQSISGRRAARPRPRLRPLPSVLAKSPRPLGDVARSAGKSPLPRGECARSAGGVGLLIRALGLTDHAAALALQARLVEQRFQNSTPDTLLLLEHPPVIPLGRRGSRTDIFATDAPLQTKGITVHR